MGNPYDDYVSLLLIYVMYYTMKSVCVIAVILPKNQKTSGAPDKPCGVGRADANPKLLLNDT